jgi:translation initiation factor IF-1
VRKAPRRRTSPWSPKASGEARGRLDDRGPRSSSLPKGGVIAEKEEKIEMEGEIIESLRNRMFRIRLENGHEMIGYTAGRMKRYRIRMMLGDRVRIEVSPYDLDRGRIVYRLG